MPNRRVAAIRLRLDTPVSASFFRIGTGLRIDLLFDFPVPAADLVTRATRLTIRGQSLLIASEEDLLRLKSTAARSVPGDADDIAFLESRKRPRPTTPGELAITASRRMYFTSFRCSTRATAAV